MRNRFILPGVAALVALPALALASPAFFSAPRALDGSTPFLVGLGLVAGAGILSLLARPAEPAHGEEGRTLHFTAADIWALDHFCASIGHIKRAMPELGAVFIDLSRVPALDASSVVLVERTVQRLTDKGIHVTLHGCTALVGAQLERRGASA